MKRKRYPRLGGVLSLEGPAAWLFRVDGLFVVHVGLSRGAKLTETCSREPGRAWKRRSLPDIIIGRHSRHSSYPSDPASGSAGEDGVFTIRPPQMPSSSLEITDNGL